MVLFLVLFKGAFARAMGGLCPRVGWYIYLVCLLGSPICGVCSVLNVVGSSVMWGLVLHW